MTLVNIFISRFTVKKQQIGIKVSYVFQFARIHTSSLINNEKISNRAITKFYNSNDVNVIALELQLIKTRPTSFYKEFNLLQEIIPTDVNKVFRTNVKDGSV